MPHAEGHDNEDKPDRSHAFTALASLKHWGEPPDGAEVGDMDREAVVDCGWGRLIFGQTFDGPERVAAELCKEREGQRDVAFYVREPHVVLSCAPQRLFLDPSNTYRLDFRHYRPADRAPDGLTIRSATEDDRASINTIYEARGMVPVYPGFYAESTGEPALSLLVAEDDRSGRVIGTVTGVDHADAFRDPDNGCSLWALAVDPQTALPGVGEALVRHLIELFRERGRSFLDLSVMHDNEHAIRLYEKLGFEQVPVYCLKHKNPINENLFIGPAPDEELNIYARLIVDEARRRGIGVEILDAHEGYFRLFLGGRSVTCRESLSELTTAVAMSRCDDKVVTHRVLDAAGLSQPDQMIVDGEGDVHAFLERHGRVVVKPARGEQGRGVYPDLRTSEDVDAAIVEASRIADKVVVEQFVEGEDLRVIVIDDKVVAAAVRRPAMVYGDGRQTVRELIEKQSRRRAAATGGESRIPLDGETERCIAAAGYGMEDILSDGEMLAVRKTANLHTGGTIHDVTDRLSPTLCDAAVRASQALEIPVVGLDFLVPHVEGDDYVIVEANERPGLANHEPQPTAERYIDLLFPQTKPSPATWESGQ